MKTYKKVFSIILVMVISLLSLSSANIVQAETEQRWPGTLYAEFSKIGDPSKDYDADSILLAQNNNFILVDVGRWGDSATVKSTLDKRGVNYLQALIITHYDADHAGAILDVGSHINYNIGTVYGRYYSKNQLIKIYDNSPGDIYFNYIKFINLVIRISNTWRGTNISQLSVNQNALDNVDTVFEKAKQMFGTGVGIWQAPNRDKPNVKFGNATLEWKNISTSYLNEPITTAYNFAEHINDDSLVFRIVTVSGVKLLFLGDLGKLGINNLINSRSSFPIDCDILKLSHHGRIGSTTQLLLDYTTPLYSIATCVTNEASKKLTPMTLQRLQDLKRLYSGFGKLLYVGYEKNASSTFAVTNVSAYNTGTLYDYADHDK